MEGRVLQVISKETMKLQSQSNSNSYPLKKIKFSYIDRATPPVYIPLIFFYEADESTGLTTSNHPQISQRLKHSLLDILPSFYSLAGRVKGNNYVDCNINGGAAGIEFVEARVHTLLKDVVQHSDAEEMKHFIPPECTTFDHGKQPLLVVQITFFACGGLVVGVCLSHKVADCASAMAFIDAWAGKCRGKTDQVPSPKFGTHPFFPSFRIIPFGFFTKFFRSNGEFVTRRFVFGNEKLEILKQAAAASSESGVKDPSRVELVSAFIWKHFMAASLENNLQSWKIFAAFVAVNLRPRTSPPGALENVFGNSIMWPLAFADGGDIESSGKFHRLVSKLRRTIRRVRGDYITKPLNRKGSFMQDLVKIGVLLLMGKLEWCYFTSWRGFPMYEVDYGWGKPLWFTTPSLPIKNFVVLVNSSTGDDIEAIVTMKHSQVQMLQAQIDLISTINV